MRRSVVLLSVIFLSAVISLSSFAWASDSVSSVMVADYKAEFRASEGMQKVRYFTLDSPKRLVVDLYGIQPGDHDNMFSLSHGFKTLRVGPYEDKTRFVFDVSDDTFPIFEVVTDEQTVVVTWQPVASTAHKVAAEPATVGTAQVSAIDFSSVSGQSVLEISLAGSAVASQLIEKKNKINFSLENTTLPRALRRNFDTLAFPSAIHSVNPYLVNVGGQPEVRFVVTLKDDVPYRLEKTEKGYAFIVTDGPFATVQTADTGMLPVAVEELEPGLQPMPKQVVSTSPTLNNTTVPVIDNIAADDVAYSGAKTSLVFDNAEVRDILRLIAEISNLNIIASDEIKGNVTLRLIDVPWDQALALVLDITNLGMLQEGNVVRVLPKSKIRSMKEAELTAARSQEKLEPLVTEVVTVSYADLGSVVDPVKNVLSDRGSITADNRNKLLIINDVMSRLIKAKELITILDTPERQVMIEARIVEVNTDYSRQLGVNWGFSYDDNDDDAILNALNVGAGGDFLVGTFLGSPGLGAGFRFGETLLDGGILDMRISALETGSKLKVVSTPRVTTLNGEEAIIKQGTEIPYQTVEDGEVKIEFKEVVLELKVTPVINPDGSIILAIEAKNDSPIPGGEGALSKKSANTKVLVRDAETTVLGGVFIDREGDGDAGIPFLSKVPLLGHLFKATDKSSSKDELLIFITPRILSNN